MDPIASPGTEKAPHRLLLVEDEFLIRLTLTETLEEAGYQVLEASDADEAMGRLADGPVDVLLTDIQLRGPVNGHELASRIRETYPELPVIFMTGRPEPGTGGGGARREMFISKPYLPSEVCAAVERMLGA